VYCGSIPLLTFYARPPQKATNFRFILFVLSWICWGTFAKQENCCIFLAQSNLFLNELKLEGMAMMLAEQAAILV
jgi:hypothetical protein